MNGASSGGLFPTSMMVDTEAGDDMQMMPKTLRPCLGAENARKESVSNATLHHYHPLPMPLGTWGTLWTLPSFASVQMDGLLTAVELRRQLEFSLPSTHLFPFEGRETYTGQSNSVCTRSVLIVASVT